MSHHVRFFKQTCPPLIQKYCLICHQKALYEKKFVMQEKEYDLQNLNRLKIWKFLRNYVKRYGKNYSSLETPQWVTNEFCYSQQNQTLSVWYLPLTGSWMVHLKQCQIFFISYIQSTHLLEMKIYGFFQWSLHNV